MPTLTIHDVIPDEVGLPRDSVERIGKYAMKQKVFEVVNGVTWWTEWVLDVHVDVYPE